MRIAVLSDAHGNWIYYSQIIEAVEKYKPDILIFLGDAFGYQRDGIKIYNDLKKRRAVVLKGNHEAMLCGELEYDHKKDEVYKLQSVKKELSLDLLKELKNLPHKYTLSFKDKNLLFIHGSPENELCGYLYEDDKSYSWISEYDYIFMGHTHRRYIKKINNSYFVNVGSCGLPRDIGLEPCFCIVNTESEDPEIVSIKINPSILDDDYYSKVHKSVKEVLLRR